MAIIDTREAAREAVENAVDLMSAIGQRACRPIYRGREGALEHWGSGTFLEIDGRDHFVTAAHVLDGHEEGSFFIGLETLKPINMTLAATVAPDGNRSQDKYDFAVAEVDQSWRKSGIEPVKFVRNRSYDVPIVSAFGWPNSRNKSRSINHTRRNIQPTCRQFLSGVMPVSKKLEAEGFRDADHLVMHRAKYGIVEGKKVRNFEPRGMSGGIIFGLPNVHKAEVLAGIADPIITPLAIVIEKNQDEQALIGTRIDVIANILVPD